MESLRQFYQQLLGASELERSVLATIAVVLLTASLRYVALRLVYRRIDDTKALYQWRKGVTYASYLLAFLVIGGVWFQGFQSVSTFLGLLSAGLAIALQDPIGNFAGWMFILWRRPFEAGDRIQIGEFQGDVIDVRIFQFSLMEIGNWVDADQSTGRIVHVPNGKVFREPLANFSRAFRLIWNEIPVLVTYESNWRKAKEILSEIAQTEVGDHSEAAERQVKQAAREYMIVYTHLDPVVYTKIADSGVLLTIRYLCEPRKRRGTEHSISETILARFGECDDIDFAYPTYRIYNNVGEGKPGARAERQ